MSVSRTKFLALLLGLVAALAPTASRADVFDVTLDTSKLVSGTYGSGPDYSLYFGLTQGDPAQSNTVAISSFNFGTGGAPLGLPTLGSGATGDLGTSVTLDNSATFLADFFQAFKAGDLLTFTLNLTTNYAGSTPDNFFFAILDSSLSPIPTADTGSNTQFSVDLKPGLVSSFFDVFVTLSPNGDNPSFGPPSIQGRSVPEPSSLLLFASAVGLVALRRRWFHPISKDVAPS
jgi:hypothetical protein